MAVGKIHTKYVKLRPDLFPTETDRHKQTGRQAETQTGKQAGMRYRRRDRQRQRQTDRDRSS